MFKKTLLTAVALSALAGAANANTGVHDISDDGITSIKSDYWINTTEVSGWTNWTSNGTTSGYSEWSSWNTTSAPESQELTTRFRVRNELLNEVSTREARSTCNAPNIYKLCSSITESPDGIYSTSIWDKGLTLQYTEEQTRRVAGDSQTQTEVSTNPAWQAAQVDGLIWYPEDNEFGVEFYSSYRNANYDEALAFRNAVDWTDRYSWSTPVASSSFTSWSSDHSGFDLADEWSEWSPSSASETEPTVEQTRTIDRTIQERRDQDRSTTCQTEVERWADIPARGCSQSPRYTREDPNYNHTLDNAGEGWEAGDKIEYVHREYRDVDAGSKTETRTVANPDFNADYGWGAWFDTPLVSPTGVVYQQRFCEISACPFVGEETFTKPANGPFYQERLKPAGE